jgi:hypothetical protein
MPRKPKDKALAISEKRTPLNWRESKALQQVFDTVPREEIIGALLDSGLPKAVNLAERLSDGAFDRTGLAKHCAAVDLLPRDVWNILIDTRKLSAKLAISEKLVEIANSVAEAAVTRVVTCGRCKGEGYLPGKKKDDPPTECTNCWGSRQIVIEGDLDRQKMALEMGELLNQKVPLIAQQFNSYKGGAGGVELGVPDMGDWVRSSDGVFEESTAHSSSVQEAEIVK